MRLRDFRRLALTATTAGFLTACAAADTAINHSTLDVQTHMSETVFLDPVPPTAKTIYVSARNTSDHPEIDLRGTLTQAMTARGYQVVQDPQAAHYMLRINVLQAGKIKPENKQSLLASNYGEPLLGAVAGAAIGGAVSGGNPYAMTGGGLALGLATFAANQLVKAVTYSVVVDIQLSERPLSGAKVNQRTSTLAAQANGSSERTSTGKRTGASPQVSSSNGTSSLNAKVKTQDVFEQNDFKQYQIRTVAYADQMNLKFEDAAPTLITKLTSSLSNLFE